MHSRLCGCRERLISTGTSHRYRAGTFAGNPRRRRSLHLRPRSARKDFATSLLESKCLLIISAPIPGPSSVCLPGLVHPFKRSVTACGDRKPWKWRNQASTCQTKKLPRHSDSPVHRASHELSNDGRAFRPLAFVKILDPRTTLLNRLMSLIGTFRTT